MTQGYKSYAVFTYKCESLSWLSPATIGFNAPPNFFETHPLTGLDLAPDLIACVHQESVWNNVIFDLEQSDIVLSMTPAPDQSIGMTLC